MNRRAVKEANKAVLPMVATIAITALIGAGCWYAGQWLNMAPQIVFGWLLTIVGIPAFLLAMWVMVYRDHAKSSQRDWWL